MATAAPLLRNSLLPSHGARLKRSRSTPKRVLVIGGAGYLGSILVRQLLQQGFSVRVLDTFWFGSQSLEKCAREPHCELIRGDMRHSRVAAHCMTACDAVILLAAVVGDSACEQHPRLAVEVNRNATTLLAKLARDCGVPRFVFASSCSVYGASEHRLDEDSPVRPLSLYAQTKSDSENILLQAETLNFHPTVFRLGTLFGLSPRMRFDLVLNLFVAQAASSRRITLWNGEQWRPFLHVQDAARAFIACLDAPPSLVSGQVFNVGSDNLNVQIGTLSTEVSRVVPNTHVNAAATQDHRNYHVSFGKIARTLGFSADRSLASGINEIYDWIRSRNIPDFRAAQFSNERAMRALLREPNGSILSASKAPPPEKFA